mmetsp:Transcript_1780/g.4433  ORF Transcript_1780/g.4433 Transcript_1780/m.4433 type:complete len:150 (-) Transcript_1780:480-929(-)
MSLTRALSRSLRPRAGAWVMRSLATDGQDPTPPDFAKLINELSAKSAAAVNVQGGKVIAKSRDPDPDVDAHGRIEEMQLHRLLTLSQDESNAAADVHQVANEMGIREGDPGLAAALDQLRAPIIAETSDGSYIGLWEKPDIFGIPGKCD